MRYVKYFLALLFISLSAPASEPRTVNWTEQVGHAISVNCPNGNTPPFQFWQKQFSPGGFELKASVRVAQQNNVIVSSRVSYTGSRAGVFAEEEIASTNAAIWEIAAANGCLAKSSVAQHRLGL